MQAERRILMQRKRYWIVLGLLMAVCLHLLAGCADPEPLQDGYGIKPVQQVGDVPEVFEAMIKTNAFHDAIAFEDRLLKGESILPAKNSVPINCTPSEHRIRMMDLYGNDLCEYTCSSDRPYHISTLTATSDGGFLFVLGFQDYFLGQDSWASDYGFASRVLKIDKNGKLQFDTPFDQVEGHALDFCFERGGRFFFFGTIQTPETKVQGVGSPSDVYMAVLDEHGSIIKTASIAGSDFDDLYAAEMTDDGFLLSISAQSDDGDFAGSDSGGYSVDWVFTVNEDLEITEKEKRSGRSISDYRIGEKEGSPVYSSDPLLEGFDAGHITAFIDYGDAYLIVSENKTGIYGDQPTFISSIWYYTETVYSLYESDGKLIFRAAVDSSPDYDSFVFTVEPES